MIYFMKALIRFYQACNAGQESPQPCFPTCQLVDSNLRQTEINQPLQQKTKSFLVQTCFIIFARLELWFWWLAKWSSAQPNQHHHHRHQHRLPPSPPPSPTSTTTIITPSARSAAAAGAVCGQSARCRRRQRHTRRHPRGPSPEVVSCGGNMWAVCVPWCMCCTYAHGWVCCISRTLTASSITVTHSRNHHHPL